MVQNDIKPMPRLYKFFIIGYDELSPMVGILCSRRGDKYSRGEYNKGGVMSQTEKKVVRQAGTTRPTLEDALIDWWIHFNDSTNDDVKIGWLHALRNVKYLTQPISREAEVACYVQVVRNYLDKLVGTSPVSPVVAAVALRFALTRSWSENQKPARHPTVSREPLLDVLRLLGDKRINQVFLERDAIPRVLRDFLTDYQGYHYQGHSYFQDKGSLETWLQAVLNTAAFELLEGVASRAMAQTTVPVLQKFLENAVGAQRLSVAMQTGHTSLRRLVKALALQKAWRGDYDFDLFPPMLDPVRDDLNRLAVLCTNQRAITEQFADFVNKSPSTQQGKQIRGLCSEQIRNAETIKKLLETLNSYGADLRVRKRDLKDQEWHIIEHGSGKGSTEFKKLRAKLDDLDYAVSSLGLFMARFGKY